jgi:hypothetical protein
VLTGVLISCAAIGHANTPVPGAYTDGPGLRFFEMLTFGQIDYSLTSFDETVEKSLVIARGHLLDVIPGRRVSFTAAPDSPGMHTVFLKILPSTLLKGNRENYYLVEIAPSQQIASELRDELYTGELLFLLTPASNIFVNSKISVSPEARAEWFSGKSLYTLTMRSTLFTITASGNLASPLDVYWAFDDLYTKTRSLDDLESHILSIQGGQRIPGDQTTGGSRQWYETDPNSGPHGLVQERYDSGKLRSETYYDNGQMQGPAQYWYESGALQAEVHFNNGQADGPSRYWSENGQQLIEATYQEGQRVECSAWTQDGSPTECR